MKFCENCGAQLEDEDTFCTNCGTKQTNIEETGQQPTLQQTAPSEQKAKPSVKRKLNKKAVIPLVLAVAAIVVAVTVYFQMKKRVDVNQYISVEYSGYKIDRDGLVKAVLKAQGKNSSQILSDDSAQETVYDTLRECMDITLSNSGNLSNGDTVTVKIECNEYINSLLGVKLIYKEKEYKVEGLEEASQVNVFDSVRVTFSGTSPNATATVNNDSDDSYLSGLKFKLSKSSGIKTGDKITDRNFQRIHL